MREGEPGSRLTLALMIQMSIDSRMRRHAAAKICIALGYGLTPYIREPI